MEKRREIRKTGKEDKAALRSRQQHDLRELRDPQDEQDDAPQVIEGRNAVLEAFRAGRTIDKLYVQEALNDGPIMSILREAAKYDTVVTRVKKERLDQLSQTGRHQGVLAQAAAFEYADVDDILDRARAAGEAPFIFILDNIEDPHNLGAIIRTANLAGAHGVIIPKRRAAGLTATAVKESAGAVNYTPVAKITKLEYVILTLKTEE